MKNGIKPDTLAALRTAPLQIATLFPDSVTKRAEEDIAHYDNKGQSASSSARGKGRYHPSALFWCALESSCLGRLSTIKVQLELWKK